MAHLGLQRIMIPGSQVSALTTGNIALAGAKGAFLTWGGPEGAYDALASTTVPSGGVASVTFNGIPSNYKHLQLRILGRSNAAVTTCYALLRFNGDSTSTNYGLHQFLSQGTGTGSSSYNGTFSGAIIERLAGNSLTTYAFGSIIVDILDANSPTKRKTVRSIGGVEGNTNSTAGSIYLNSNFWLDTNPIQQIVVTLESGASFMENSSLALYGVK